MGRVDRDNAHDAKLEAMQIASSLLLNVDTHHIKRRMQDAADQVSVRRRQFLARVGFDFGELAKNTDMLVLCDCLSKCCALQLS